MNLASWVMHGFMLASEYEEHAVFGTEPANPLHFFAVAICVGIAAALLFAKTRKAWPYGLGGGLQFGFFAGLVTMFQPLYNPLVIDGFPYHLGWCWGGVNVIVMIIAGVVISLVVKRD